MCLLLPFMIETQAFKLQKSHLKRRKRNTASRCRGEPPQAAHGAGCPNVSFVSFLMQEHKPRKLRESTSQERPRSRGHSGPILIHKLPGLHCFGGPFWRNKQGRDWMILTLLDSLTCLFLQGQKHFGSCIKHFTRRGHLSTYCRFGSRKPDLLFCLVSTNST